MARARTAGIAVLLVVAAMGTGCGADFESETFSVDIAEGFVEVDQSTFGDTGPEPVGIFGTATMENVATFGPDESGEMRAYVDIFRISGISSSPVEGIADGSTTRTIAETFSALGASAGGVQPRRTELGGVDAIEMTSAPVEGSLSEVGVTRTLVASRGEDLYIITQVASDNATLAHTAIGFTKVVDSWEWKD